MPQSATARTIVPPDLNQFRGFLPHLPALDLERSSQAAEFCQRRAIGGWQQSFLIGCAAIQGRFPIRLNHPRVCVFAGIYSSASADAVESLRTEVKILSSGQGRLPELCQKSDCDLRLYEMNLSTATKNEAEAAHAIAYGMTAVDAGVDLMIVQAMQAGGGDAYDALLHSDSDALDQIASGGGREMAGIAGAILAARMARVPVILDGMHASIIGAALSKLYPTLTDHCWAVVCDDDAAKNLVNFYRNPVMVGVPIIEQIPILQSLNLG